MEQEYLDDAIDHNEAVWLIRKHKFTFADAIHGVKDDRRDRAIAAYLSAGGAI
jgi:hypothetical protein